MTARVQLIVPGDPQPAERARRGRGRWYTPPATVEYRQRVEWAWKTARAAGFGAAPLTISASFHLPRPVSHHGTGRNIQAVKPSCRHLLPPGDLDNYLKGLLDGLQAAGAFDNDKQVACLSGVSKHWATAGDARTEVTIWLAQPIALDTAA